MKKQSSDTAINEWLLSNSNWVTSAEVLSGTLLIQNVVNDCAAIITYAEFDEAEEMWLVNYYYNGSNFVQWACEMWNWRVLDDKKSV